MKAIVVRTAIAGARLPFLALALVARPALSALAALVRLPFVVLGLVLGAVFAVRGLLLYSAVFAIRRLVRAWLEPWLLAFRVLRLPFLALRWLVRLLF